MGRGGVGGGTGAIVVVGGAEEVATDKAPGSLL